MTTPVRTIVFADGVAALHLRSRTIRSLARAGVEARDHCLSSAVALGEALASGDQAAWLLREGAWRVGTGPATFPPPSRTGRPLCALGAVIPASQTPPGGDEARWAETLAATGGDLDGRRSVPLPPLVSVFLDAALATSVGHRMSAGQAMPVALEAVLRETHARVVRYAPLDVHADPALRVAQAVTSLQQGGAERIAMDLAAALGRFEVHAVLVALGGPTRAAFPTPPAALDLSRKRVLDREGRLLSLLDAVDAFGADVVHAHLLEGRDVAHLAASGLPMVATIHNVRPGWPAGIEDLRAGEASLLVACARAVEADLRDARLAIPLRTVWNGVDFAAFAPPAAVARARRWRNRLGFGAGDLVLLAVANPRPQKRLPLLPHVLAATRAHLERQGAWRQARLVIAGSGWREGDRAVLEEVSRAAAQLGLADHVRLAGSVDDVAGLLAASDVLVSTSAYEGLSLAHLEALASSLPLVATAAGGTPELGHDNPAVVLVPPDAAPDAYATAVVSVASAPRRDGRNAAALHFTRERMAQDYARLYPRAVAAHYRRRAGGGLLIVTNNFSTGGAQSSARRLLLGLRDQGVRVRAAVLEEQEEYPTPGRRALQDAGIEVAVLPASALAEARAAVGVLLDRIDHDPPDAVLFWNALAGHKILLADALLDIPVFDVSPGEMYYESLARYLAWPRPGMPYRVASDYGARLAGVIVKYGAEADRAAKTLGAPVHVIPNGVPLAPLRRARPPEEDRPLVIGTLARLDPRKKVHELLEAIAQANGRLPPHVLRIAGGVERGCAGYAEELRRRAGGAPVEWVGELSEPAPFLDDLDLFALVAEPAGCPNASLEAMSAGLPVVATDVGGISEQVVEGVTGRVVPPGDPGALADALVHLARDAAARARLGEAGRQRIHERFRLERMVAEYRRVCLPGF